MNAPAMTPLDRLLIGVENALEAVAGRPDAQRNSPALEQSLPDLEDQDRRHAAGLMRINHTGEVCAQALYKGQALLARDEATRSHLLHAAEEETDHLAWCADRLRELDSRPSLLNPAWYAGSMAIGAAAAAASDRFSLGFVVETERQVEAHLAEHIERLPSEDARSRSVLRQMQSDEASHAEQARVRGGVNLPAPIPTVMRLASQVMKAVAYRI